MVQRCLWPFPADKRWFTHIIRYTKIKIDFVIRTQQQRNSKLEWKKKNLQHGICITLDALWIFPSSFRSVKVNVSHYACSLHTLASRCMCTRTHTHTHETTTQEIQSLFLEGFTFLYPRSRKKGLKETLVIPLSCCRPEGRWKVGVILWIPSFLPLFSPSPSLLVLLSPLCSIHPAVHSS